MGRDVILVSDLNQHWVLGADGRRLGRLHELEAENGRVERIVFGKAGFMERMTGRSAPTKRPWADVLKIDKEGIHLRPR